MRIVVQHDERAERWWAAVSDDGKTSAVSVPHLSRTDCMRSLAELRVEGPTAPVIYENDASSGAWAIGA